MGNDAQLAAFEPIDRVLVPGSAPELVANHFVPIFWLAMFDAADVRDEPLTGVRYNGKDGLFAIPPPYLATDQASAIARLKKRTPALATLVGEGHRKLLRDFTAFARRLKPNLVVRLSEIAETMTDRAQYAADIRAALGLVAKLDDPEARPDSYHVAPLTGVWSGSDWVGAEHVTELLSGWGWQVSPEARAKRARERKWQKTVGDRPSAELVPYAATRTFAPDELVAHPTLGSGVVVRVVDSTKVEVLFQSGAKTLVHGRK